MNKKLGSLIAQVENYLECWKQFNRYLLQSRSKKFGDDDETQFLEVKSVLVQELELILSAVEVTSPSKDEIHSLIGNAASLRSLSEQSEGAVRNIESQWHKIYIGWHAILGQLKVQLQNEPPKGFFASRAKK